MTLESTYEELKLPKVKHVYISKNELESTYEELKQSLSNIFFTSLFNVREYLWGIETFPDYEVLLSLFQIQLESTYEELKHIINKVLCLCNLVREYLWGIETIYHIFLHTRYHHCWLESTYEELKLFRIL